jgi:glycosyltransferase involved in cell wall biosynthesis
MKVLIHSNGPHVPSGYGKQARYAGRILRDLGHQVAFSCFSGLSGQPIRWDGCTLFPAGAIDYSPDMIVPHAQAYGADVIMPIMDFFKLGPAARQLAEVRDQGTETAAFIINDCRAEDGGISAGDRRVLAASGATPVAVSKFGQENLAATGYPDAPYVPHCADLSVFRPPEDRQALREELGTPGEFVIGIMAANRDVVRKGFPEQMAAFARFSRRHKGVTLAMFTEAQGASGINLAEIAADLGIGDKTIFMPSYEQVAGMLPDELCAKWFGSIDVLSLCSYAEAFGVPLIEAQACGTPVIATDFSAMSELAYPAGWLVKGQRFWNPAHRAWWCRPDEDAIVKAYEKAYQEGPSQLRRDRAVAVASQYGIEHVQEMHWRPFTEKLEAGL